MTKNFSVDKFRLYINDLLANPKISQTDKAAYCGALEHVLMKSKNYHGFQYTYWAKIGYHMWIAAGEPGFPEKQEYIGNEYDREYY